MAITMTITMIIAITVSQITILQIDHEIFCLINLL